MARVVGAACHAADLVVDLCQVGQLMMERERERERAGERARERGFYSRNTTAEWKMMDLLENKIGS